MSRHEFTDDTGQFMVIGSLHDGWLLNARGREVLNFARADAVPVMTAIADAAGLLPAVDVGAYAAASLDAWYEREALECLAIAAALRAREPGPDPADIDKVAAVVREVDGNHDLGAAALAEALLASGVVKVAKEDK